MYNCDQKERYISETGITGKELYFEKIADYEEEAGRDLCNLSTGEIILFYKLCFTHSLDQLMVMNNVFKNYTDWCILNGLVTDSQNHYAEINNDYLVGCVNTGLLDKKIISKEEMKDICDRCRNYSNKFIVSGLFDGLGEDYCMEIGYATPDKYDTETGELTTYYGRRVKISPETFEYLKKACAEEIYVYASGFDVRLIESQYPIKPIDFGHNNPVTQPDGPLMIQRIRNRMQDIKKVAAKGKEITTKSLRDSGLIDAINSLAAKPGETTIDKIYRNREEIESKYGKFSSINRFVIKYQKYLK